VDRFRRAVCLLALLLATVTPFLAGCSGAAEYTVISQFFNASRLLDNTSLASVATIIFDPRTQGTVITFSIESISPGQRQVVPPKGEQTSEHVTVSARVRLPDGTTAQKTFVITLQRATPHDDKDAGGRWIVTEFRDGAAPAGRTSS
jgi:hypothetical protein